MRANKATVLFISFGVAAISLTMRRSERGLLSICTKVADVKEWNLYRGTTNPQLINADLSDVGATYQWIDNHRILFFRHSTIGDIQEPVITRRSNLDYNVRLRRRPTEGGEPTLYNCTTGGEQPLPRLTNTFARSHGIAASTQVSPDGKWLFWRNHNCKGHISSLQGDHYQQLKDYWNIHWSANGQLAEVNTSEDSLTVSAGVLSLEGARNLVPTRYTIPLSADVFGPMFVDAFGSLLVTDWHRSEKQTKTVVLSRLAPGNRTPNLTVAITIPPDSRIDGMMFSPRGDRIAWVLTQMRISPLMRLLQKSSLPIRYRPKAIAGLWISRIDGRFMHEIGHVDCPNPSFNAPIDYVSWLPDGKHMSFAYRYGLFVTSAD